ncbi:MAG: stage V sporulation protein D, partial [Acutalibacteraceae bacterium]|nr:stage V sporulation protein D [Acutalibacteraceae bacterium]
MSNVGSNKTIIFRSKVLLALLLVFGFGLAIARLFYFSIIRGDELQQRAYSQQLNDTTISAKRGVIYDTNGKILAQSATVWQVVLVPKYIENDEQRTYIAQRLAEILDLDQETVFNKAKGTSYYSVVKRQVETVEKDKVVELIDELDEKYELGNAIYMIEDYKRYYP